MACTGLAGGTVPSGAVTGSARTGPIAVAGVLCATTTVFPGVDVACGPISGDRTSVAESATTTETSRRALGGPVCTVPGSGGGVVGSRKFTMRMYRTTSRGH